MRRTSNFRPTSSAGLLLLASLLGLSGTSLQAQTPPPDSSLDRQIDEAFQRVLKAPADASAGNSYATLLVKAGNYEGAIAALERQLLDPQAPPTARMELAVLYYRLGSYAMSESLLRQTLEDTRLTADLRQLADNLLRDVAFRNQTSQWSGLAMLGLRSQTNPSARASGDLVYSAGTLVPLPQQFKPKSDSDLQAMLRVDHRYDLGLQNEAAVVSSLVAQAINFSSSSGHQLQATQVKPYDLTVVDVTTGVRFKPSPLRAPKLTLRPYLGFAHVGAQGHHYLRNHGIGLEADYRLNERTLFSAGYEHRHYDYAQRIDFPDAALRGGPDNSLRARLSRETAPGQVLSGEVALRSHKAGKPLHGYDSQEVRLTYSLSYSSPWAATSGDWVTSAWAGATRRSYDGADAAVHPQILRRDTEWRVGLAHTVPVASAWALLLQLEHVRTNANLPNYQNSNTSVLGALTYRF